MGNSNTKESRHGDSAPRGHRGAHGTGANGTSSQQTPEQRRETKQEREARRLEKERVARIKERERSIREEHVDGGYLVTMGTYTGPEDFNKQIVRQLQVSYGRRVSRTCIQLSPRFANYITGRLTER